ncbi:GH25 family lysozyme, partial [Arthrospira platensis SPKY2]
NWEQVKDHVDFVMLRAGYGRNNIDKQFIRNIEECNRLGIPVGIYWFSYAWNEEMARNEAKYVLEAIKGYRVDYPISFDLEYDTLNYAKKNGVTIGKRLATDMINAFCSTIEQAGYKAMNYANPDFINNKFYNNEVNYPLWLAW